MLSDGLETFTIELLLQSTSVRCDVIVLLSIIRSVIRSPQFLGIYVAHAQTVDTRPRYSESLKSNTPPSLPSYCLPVEVSPKEQQLSTKDLPLCSERSGTSPTVQLLAGSDAPSPSVCYGLLYNVYAAHVRQREGQLEQYPL